MPLNVELLVASGRQPAWVEAGFDEYAKRLRGRVRVELRAVALAGHSVPRARAVAEEGRRLLAASPKGAHVVVLDERGSAWSTRALAARLEHWMGLGAPVALLIGGPDGLSSECLARADERWCVSPLTLPHGLVRVIVAEALYRALSLLEGHPYHRD